MSNPTQLDLFAEVTKERIVQDAQWGGPTTDDKRDWYEWRSIFYRQLTLLSMDAGDHARQRQRYVKIAAIAIAALESHDRKHNG